LFYANAVVTYTGINIQNFDLSTDWDNVIGGNYIITFRDCLFQGNNKGVVVKQPTTNSFEKMMWDGCCISGNNYGVYIITQTNPSAGSGNPSAMDFNFFNCSIDYNVVNMVYYLNAAYGGDFMGSLYLTNCHLETNVANSGNAARIAHDGNLCLNQCECFENGGNPTGGLINHLSFASRSSIINSKGPGNGYSGNAPIISSSNSLLSVGYGNTNRAAGSVQLVSTLYGTIYQASTTDSRWAAIGSNTTLSAQHAAAPGPILVNGTCTITIPWSNTIYFGQYQILPFFIEAGVTATFAPAANVTLTGDPQYGLVVTGPQNCQLVTTNPNTWTLSSSSRMSLPVPRIVTASGTIIQLVSDNVIVVNKTTPANTAITLMTSPPTGQTVTIKDGAGNANTYNITITPAAGNIDGAATLVLNTAYAGATLMYNGTIWNIIANSI
jgi:hypothetical protein